MDKTAVRLVIPPSRWPRFGLRALLVAMALVAAMLWSGMRTYQLLNQRPVPVIAVPLYEGRRLHFTDEQFLNILVTLQELQPPKLDVSSSPITDKSADGLNHCGWLSELNLSNTGFTDQGLAQLQNLNALKMFFLYGTRVTCQGAWNFSQRHLNTAICWGDNRVQATMKNGGVALTYSRVSPESLAMARVTCLKSLTCFPDCGMTDQDLYQFKEHDLETLEILNTDITDKSGDLILEFPHLKRLVLPQSISPAVARRIKEGLPQGTDFNYLGTISD